ncbi:hypothetical protein ACU639_00580 [Streptomyces cynarae]|uniref:hypothetical protein n=1 Tax=Streptomyces cynarae TaxID=2981134 RepID=UPI00406D0083
MQRTLDVRLVQPAVVMEVAVDVARDNAGRWRHPARPHRVRTDVDLAHVPLFDEDAAASSALRTRGSARWSGWPRGKLLAQIEVAAQP